MSADADRRVRLLQLPLPLWAHAKQHTDELLREFAIIAAGKASGTTAGTDTPQRLLELVAVLRQQYGAGSSERDERLFSALDAGQVELDDTVELPAAAAGGAQALSRLLDEADEFCRQGRHLLTLASPPELVRFRRWYLEEVVVQLQGGDPTPWPAYRP